MLGWSCDHPTFNVELSPFPVWEYEIIYGNENLFLEFYLWVHDKVVTQVQEYARIPRLVSYPSSKALYMYLLMHQ